MRTIKSTKLASLTPLLVLVALSGLAFAATPAMAELTVKRFAVAADNANGTPDLLAGSHPYGLTTTFVLQQQGFVKAGLMKNVKLELPPGLVGSSTATPQCAYQEFAKGLEQGVVGCPNDTAVGIATAFFPQKEESQEWQSTSTPVYNLVPPPGMPVEFGFIVAHASPVLLGTAVRTGADYGVTTTTADINQTLNVIASKVTIWGDPADPEHNPWRGTCLKGQPGVGTTEPAGQGLLEGEDLLEGPLYGAGEEPEGGLPVSRGNCPANAPEKPLLTNPTSCNAPRTATLSVDSWDEPDAPSVVPDTMPVLEGCEKLPFGANTEVAADQTSASTPTGVDVDVRVPQEGVEDPGGAAEADVKTTTVTLPAGFQVNPSSAGALQGCSEAQVGYTESKELNPAGEPGVLTAQFTPYLPGSIAAKEAVAAGKAPQSAATLQPGVNFCPEASKIANVKIKTPLLEDELEGGMYLASPQNNLAGVTENPFGSLIALYLVAEDPKTGVLVKLPGHVELGEPGVSNGLQPGQIRTVFQNTPQVPFSDLYVQFFGGERAPLATPARCGEYETQFALSSWSSSIPFDTLAPSLGVSSGPAGTACPGAALPFAPYLAGGVSDINAGAFTPLTTTIGREDGQQALHKVTVTYPPGVSAILAGVPLCPEAQANAGTCSPASQIGEATATAGLGADPVAVNGGKVYLTESYEGAPFGLSIVTPAVAGPFNLGNVIVRGRIEINPTTAQVTVTTGEIPSILRGVPLDIKHVNVTVGRPGFTFNPTSCTPTSLTGTVGGLEGASALVSSPFQVASCANLKFTPKFNVSTAGHTSKALGASLTAKVTEPAGAMGSQANIARVKVDLPIQLPSQLKTLQKACLAKTFEEGYEKCLKESPQAKVGEAVVYTPLLPVPLKGPAIFVSHGNEAFPSLTMVLQGYGVTIDLVGSTLIKKGITSTTFKTVPDVPFTSFELTLPQGKFAALTSNLPEKDKGNLCGQNLKMPTEFLAQNGTKINEDTQIDITGCAKVKALTRAQKLSKALKACRKDKGNAKRATCEAKARKQYGPVKKTKKKGRK
jgi:hypothetical protein